MTSYSVTVKPGVTAPVGAVDVPLTNLRPSMQPVGPIKAIMDQLTGTYTALERARIAQTWFDLYDAGLFNKLDQLNLFGRTLNDCLIPWVPTAPTIITGGTGGLGGAGQGLQFVSGEGDFLETGYNPSTFVGAKHTLNSASFAILLTEGMANNQYAFGSNAAGGGVTSLQRTGGSAQNLTVRINTTDITTWSGYAGQGGMVIGNRPSGTVQRLLFDGVVVAEETNNLPTALNNGVFSLGRQGSVTPVFADMKAAGFAIGAGLTQQEESDLTAIMKRIWNALK